MLILVHGHLKASGASDHKLAIISDKLVSAIKAKRMIFGEIIVDMPLVGILPPGIYTSRPIDLSFVTILSSIIATDFSRLVTLYCLVNF